MKNNNLVHVFGVPNLKACSKEENELFFNKDFDINDLFESKTSDYIDTSSYENAEAFLRGFKLNKGLSNKISYILGLTLFISSNPKFVFAFSNRDNIIVKVPEKLGTDIFDSVSTIVIYGIIIITALRLLSEYSRGGSRYKATEIIKECATVLLIVIVLPMLPGVVKKIVSRYLTF